jgi:hypothetical protein
MDLTLNISEADRKLLGLFINAVNDANKIIKQSNGNGAETKTVANQEKTATPPKQPNKKAPPAKAANKKETNEPADKPLKYDDVRAALTTLVKEHTTTAVGEILKRYPECQNPTRS